MAGIDVGTARGSRRELDSQLNMVPMIDLMMVTIAFLLITAVWTHMGRFDANANVPGQKDACIGNCPKTRELHLDMRSPDTFVFTWKEGASDLRPPSSLPRVEHIERSGPVKQIRYDGLAERLRAEWNEMGLHRGSGDGELDRVVLHTDDASPYASLVGALDAVHEVKREHTIGSTKTAIPAFHVTFAAR